MHRLRLAPGRVEQTLARALGLSRRVAVAWLQQRRVRTEGRVLRKGDRLDADLEVELQLEGPFGEWIPASTEPLPLLAQGEGWVAVNKPAGMHSHLSLPFESETALNSLVAHDAAVADSGDQLLEGGLVHRLDQACSGALLAATSRSSWDGIRKRFSEGSVRRIYRTRVAVQPSTDFSTASLVSAGPRVRVADAGRPCETRWRALDDHGLLEVQLLTGHRHQIRVHLAAAGAPILGDSLYGGAQWERLLLHCHELAWPGGRVLAPPPLELEPR